MITTLKAVVSLVALLLPMEVYTIDGTTKSTIAIDNTTASTITIGDTTTSKSTSDNTTTSTLTIDKTTETSKPPDNTTVKTEATVPTPTSTTVPTTIPTPTSTTVPTTIPTPTSTVCIFGSMTYDNGAQLPDVCTRFVCENGRWRHKGNIHSGCSQCTLQNDPHFKTFGGIRYDQHGQCNYSLTQMDKGNTPSFAVYGEFAKCISTREKPTCLSVITFKNDENSVITLENLPGYSYTFDEKFNGADMELTSSPKSFGDTSTLIAWRGYCGYGATNSCVCVLGSQGLMIQYCGWSVYVWAYNGLMGSLYGLCGYFSGDPENDLTSRNGTKYAQPNFYWPRNEVFEEFANSWEASNCTSSAGRKRRSTGTDCAADQSTFENYRNDCATSITDSNLDEMDRNTTIENCAFDRCTIITSGSTNPSPADWLNQTNQAASRTVANRNSVTNIRASSCIDKAICTSYSDSLCKYQGVVDDCPLLCHINSTCDTGVCEDAASCAGQPSVVCRYQEVVDDCPILCHTNSSCDASGQDGTSVKISFKLENKEFDEELKNEQSQEFINLKREVETMVKDGLIMKLGNRYLNSEVKSFKKGSVVAEIVATITNEGQALDEAYALVLNALRTGVVGIVTGSVNTTGCRDEFVDVNGECLKFSSERLTWAAANEQCQLLSSTLVVPADFIMMTSYIINNNLFYWQYWIGASDESTPGNYKWLDGTPVDSSIWYPGYPPAPNTSGVRPGQSCVKLHPTSNTDYGLIASWDSNCDGANTYRFICQEL